MPILQQTTFTSYELTEEELRLGSTLTSLNVCVIKTELARIAQQRLNIDYDPLNPIKFAQDEALLKGQMNSFQWLLDCNEAAMAENLKLASNSQQ